MKPSQPHLFAPLCVACEGGHRVAFVDGEPLCFWCRSICDDWEHVCPCDLHPSNRPPLRP